MVKRAWTNILRKIEQVSWKAVKTITVRIWAAAIVFVVLWAGYTAVAYLVRQVFFPTAVPQAFLEWQGHLEADLLRAEHVPGMTEESHRAPLGHYHGVKQWFQHDPANGCTVSGCHSPLPHHKTKTVRAFANFHSTFLNCMTCHTQTSARPMEAGWIDLEGAERREPPAILRLISYLHGNGTIIEEQPRVAHGTILPLLRETVKVAGDDNVLNYLLLQIDTSQPGSPVWKHTVAQLARELPAHARGEYGAKIAPGAGNDARVVNRKLQRLARDYNDAREGSPERKEIVSSIHASVRVAPQGCLACHGGRDFLLDLEALGYPPARAEELKDLPLARMAEQVRQGRRFHLWKILGLPEEESPAPSTQPEVLDAP